MLDLYLLDVVIVYRYLKTFKKKLDSIQLYAIINLSSGLQAVKRRTIIIYRRKKWENLDYF